MLLGIPLWKLIGGALGLYGGGELLSRGASKLMPTQDEQLAQEQLKLQGRERGAERIAHGLLANKERSAQRQEMARQDADFADPAVIQALLGRIVRGGAIGAQMEASGGGAPLSESMSSTIGAEVLEQKTPRDPDLRGIEALARLAQAGPPQDPLERRARRYGVA
jgi:hypothetical protein